MELKLNFLWIYIIIILSLSCLIEGRGFLETNFREFVNFEGRRMNGDCCEKSGWFDWSFGWGDTDTNEECSTECDHTVIICIGNVTHSISMSECEYGQMDITSIGDNNVSFNSHLTTFTPNSMPGSSSMSECEYGQKDITSIGGNNVSFNSHVGEETNPIRFPFQQWPGEVKIKIDVMDEDRRQVLVDHYEYQLNTEPLPQTLGAPVKELTLSGRGTKLDVDLRVLCEKYYYGPNCGIYCSETDDDTGHYNCDPQTGDKICKSGWMGDDCLTNIDDCVGNRCYFGSTCVDGINYYTCACQPGRTGPTCEAEINECASLPCQNGGQCLDEDNAFICECLSGYTGLLCETEIDECFSYPCENGGLCVDDVASYSCICPTGFTGNNCHIDEDECAFNPCVRASRCYNVPGDYVCECHSGYTGKNCGVEIDECNSDPCQNGGICIDREDGYTCRCDTGFTGSTCGELVDHCSPNYCRNGATCHSGRTQFTCECPQQFTGVLCRNDVDECTSNATLCSGHGTCTNTYGGYVCDCIEGFEGKDCELEVDECESDPCFNGGLCIDGIGTFTCECVDGFMADQCEIDIDECSSSPCGNNGSCIDKIAGFTCNCDPNYTGLNCEVLLQSKSTSQTTQMQLTTVTQKTTSTQTLPETQRSTLTHVSEIDSTGGKSTTSETTSSNVTSRPQSTDTSEITTSHYLYTGIHEPKSSSALNITLPLFTIQHTTPTKTHVAEYTKRSLAEERNTTAGENATLPTLKSDSIQLNDSSIIKEYDISPEMIEHEGSMSSGETESGIEDYSSGQEGGEFSSGFGDINETELGISAFEDTGEEIDSSFIEIISGELDESNTSDFIVPDQIADVGPGEGQIDRGEVYREEIDSPQIMSGETVQSGSGDGVVMVFGDVSTSSGTDIGMISGERVPTDDFDEISEKTSLAGLDADIGMVSEEIGSTTSGDDIEMISAPTVRDGFALISGESGEPVSTESGDGIDMSSGETVLARSGEGIASGDIISSKHSDDITQSASSIGSGDGIEMISGEEDRKFSEMASIDIFSSAELYKSREKLIIESSVEEGSGVDNGLDAVEKFGEITSGQLGSETGLYDDSGQIYSGERKIGDQSKSFLEAPSGETTVGTNILDKYSGQLTDKEVEYELSSTSGNLDKILLEGSGEVDDLSSGQQTLEILEERSSGSGEISDIKDIYLFPEVDTVDEEDSELSHEFIEVKETDPHVRTTETAIKIEDNDSVYSGYEPRGVLFETVSGEDIVPEVTVLYAEVLAKKLGDREGEGSGEFQEISSFISGSGNLGYLDWENKDGSGDVILELGTRGTVITPGESSGIFREIATTQNSNLMDSESGDFTSEGENVHLKSEKEQTFQSGEEILIEAEKQGDIIFAKLYEFETGSGEVDYSFDIDLSEDRNEETVSNSTKGNMVDNQIETLVTKLDTKLNFTTAKPEKNKFDDRLAIQQSGDYTYYSNDSFYSGEGTVSTEELFVKHTRIDPSLVDTVIESSLSLEEELEEDFIVVSSGKSPYDGSGSVSELTENTREQPIFSGIDTQPDTDVFHSEAGYRDTTGLESTGSGLTELDIEDFGVIEPYENDHRNEFETHHDGLDRTIIDIGSGDSVESSGEIIFTIDKTVEKEQMTTSKYYGTSDKSSKSISTIETTANTVFPQIKDVSSVMEYTIVGTEILEPMNKSVTTVHSGLIEHVAKLSTTDTTPTSKISTDTYSFTTAKPEKNKYDDRLAIQQSGDYTYYSNDSFYSGEGTVSTEELFIKHTRIDPSLVDTVIESSLSLEEELEGEFIVVSSGKSPYDGSGSVSELTENTREQPIFSGIDTQPDTDVFHSEAGYRDTTGLESTGSGLTELDKEDFGVIETYENDHRNEFETHHDGLDRTIIDIGSGDSVESSGEIIFTIDKTVEKEQMTTSKYYGTSDKSSKSISTIETTANTVFPQIMDVSSGREDTIVGTEILEPMNKSVITVHSGLIEHVAKLSTTDTIPASKISTDTYSFTNVSAKIYRSSIIPFNYSTPKVSPRTSTTSDMGKSSTFPHDRYQSMTQTNELRKQLKNLCRHVNPSLIARCYLMNMAPFRRTYPTTSGPSLTLTAADEMQLTTVNPTTSTTEEQLISDTNVLNTTEESVKRGNIIKNEFTDISLSSLSSNEYRSEFSISATTQDKDGDQMSETLQTSIISELPIIHAKTVSSSNTFISIAFTFSQRESTSPIFSNSDFSKSFFLVTPSPSTFNSKSKIDKALETESYLNLDEFKPSVSVSQQTMSAFSPQKASIYSLVSSLSSSLHPSYSVELALESNTFDPKMTFTTYSKHMTQITHYALSDTLEDRYSGISQSSENLDFISILSYQENTARYNFETSDTFLSQFSTPTSFAQTSVENFTTPYIDIDSSQSHQLPPPPPLVIFPPISSFLVNYVSETEGTVPLALTRKTASQIESTSHFLEVMAKSDYGEISSSTVVNSQQFSTLVISIDSAHARETISSHRHDTESLLLPSQTFVPEDFRYVHAISESTTGFSTIMTESPTAISSYLWSSSKETRLTPEKVSLDTHEMSTPSKYYVDKASRSQVESTSHFLKVMSKSDYGEIPSSTVVNSQHSSTLVISTDSAYTIETISFHRHGTESLLLPSQTFVPKDVRYVYAIPESTTRFSTIMTESPIAITSYLRSFSKATSLESEKVSLDTHEISTPSTYYVDKASRSQVLSLSNEQRSQSPVPFMSKSVLFAEEASPNGVIRTQKITPTPTFFVTSSSDKDNIDQKDNEITRTRNDQLRASHSPGEFSIGIHSAGDNYETTKSKVSLFDKISTSDFTRTSSAQAFTTEPFHSLNLHISIKTGDTFYLLPNLTSIITNTSIFVNISPTPQLYLSTASTNISHSLYAPVSSPLPEVDKTGHKTTITAQTVKQTARTAKQKLTKYTTPAFPTTKLHYFFFTKMLKATSRPSTLTLTPTPSSRANTTSEPDSKIFFETTPWAETTKHFTHRNKTFDTSYKTEPTTTLEQYMSTKYVTRPFLEQNTTQMFVVISSSSLYSPTKEYIIGTDDHSIDLKSTEKPGVDFVTRSEKQNASLPSTTTLNANVKSNTFLVDTVKLVTESGLDFVSRVSVAISTPVPQESFSSIPFMGTSNVESNNESENDYRADIQTTAMSKLQGEFQSTTSNLKTKEAKFTSESENSTTQAVTHKSEMSGVRTHKYTSSTEPSLNYSFTSPSFSNTETPNTTKLKYFFFTKILTQSKNYSRTSGPGGVSESFTTSSEFKPKSTIHKTSLKDILNPNETTPTKAEATTDLQKTGSLQFTTLETPRDTSQSPKLEATTKAVLKLEEQTEENLSTDIVSTSEVSTKESSSVIQFPLTTVPTNQKSESQSTIDEEIKIEDSTKNTSSYKTKSVAGSYRKTDYPAKTVTELLDKTIYDTPKPIGRLNETTTEHSIETITRPPEEISTRPIETLSNLSTETANKTLIDLSAEKVTDRSSKTVINLATERTTDLPKETVTDTVTEIVTDYPKSSSSYSQNTSLNYENESVETSTVEGTSEMAILHTLKPNIEELDPILDLIANTVAEFVTPKSTPGKHVSLDMNASSQTVNISNMQFTTTPSMTSDAEENKTAKCLSTPSPSVSIYDSYTTSQETSEQNSWTPLQLVHTTESARVTSTMTDIKSYDPEDIRDNLNTINIQTPKIQVKVNKELPITTRDMSTTKQTTSYPVTQRFIPATIKRSSIRHTIDLTSNNTYPNPRKEIYEYIHNKSISKGPAKLSLKQITVTVIQGAKSIAEQGKQVLLRTYQRARNITTSITVTVYKRSRQLFKTALDRVEALWKYCESGINHYIVKPLLNARVFIKEKFESAYKRLEETFARGKLIFESTVDNVGKEAENYFESLATYYTDVYRQYSTEVRDIWQSLKIPDS